MVGRREMHHCALCSNTFKSKAAYNQHLATHEEPGKTQWPCSVCGFTFGDSYALETHKAQTRHSGEKYTCDKCGSVFQTHSKLKQHSQFPSPCYAVTSGTGHIRNTPLSQIRETATKTPTQAYGRAGYFDLDTPSSVKAPVVLPYGNAQDAPSRSSTPSDVSGVYCHDCRGAFQSMASYKRHCLSCTVQNRATVESGDTATQAGACLVPSSQGSHGTATNPATMVTCRLGSCNRSFVSQAALEQHERDAHDRLKCGVDGCASKFQSQTALDQHRKANHIFLCDAAGCVKPFLSQAKLAEHKKNSHAVGSQAPPIDQPTQWHPAPTAPDAPIQAAPSQAPVALPLVPTPPTVTSRSLICGLNNCSRVFRSEAGLKQHKIDSHSVGDRGLDLERKDSRMLPQSSRNQLQNLGLHRPSGSVPQPSRGIRHAVPLSTVGVPRHAQAPVAARQSLRNPVHVPLLPVPVPNDLPIASPADIDQANDLHDKIMRMLITADTAIHHTGKIVYDGVEWVRVSVDRQNEVASKFDELVHLKRLSKQGQAKHHVSYPTVFQGDFVGDYLGSNFEQLPEPRNGSLSVVALCCSKVLLENQCEELVKIAAVDVLTGRPLMSYLVCTSATENIRDWRASLTGLSSFQDFEAARAQKFRILKGWTAARAALGKFVDQNTIFLGYNLRCDLDAFRIRHGRCVDLVKVIEKAAEKRPLSKVQLRLEALLRDLLEKRLPTDRFGRDCLHDAFAVRELALYSIKHNEKFVKYVKDKAREYGLLNPTRQ
ncbi:hypothetical protein PMIN03_007520 [Paraphaeosphaeria minitans]|uniref:Exonuclease n=1 Tax=Paraphaeosphaeria minitans TaxID=565426 RepID=A0A9P6GM81_9PLEO|nr:exonuclease [Paraphaeosphaeria minitans]